MSNKEHYYKKKLYEERKKKEPEIPNIAIPKYNTGCEITSAESSEKLVSLIGEQLDIDKTEKLANEASSKTMKIIKGLLAITACGVIGILVCSGIDLTEQFIEDFRTAKQPYSTSWNDTNNFCEDIVKKIWDNETLTDVEKAKIATGYKSFLTDYAYLLDKKDKQNLIYLFENLTVNRSQKILFDENAKFSGKELNFKYGLINVSDDPAEKEKLNELSKESIAIVGDTFWINGIDEFQWMNDAIKQAINEKHFNGSKLGSWEKDWWISRELSRLSIIIDKDIILQFFLNDNYNNFIDGVNYVYPGLNKVDLFGYLSTLSLIYKIEKIVPECKLYEKLEDSVVNYFYTKLFKQRYSVDFDKTLYTSTGFNSLNDNFLNDTVEMRSINDLNTCYRVPKEDVHKISNDSILQDYPIIERSESYLAHYNYLAIPEDFDSLEKQGFDESYLNQIIYNRLSTSDNPEVQRKNDSLYSELMSYSNLDDFLYLYIHNLFLNDMSPEQMACHIKETYKYFVNNIMISEYATEDSWRASEKPLTHELTKNQLSQKFITYVVNALKNAGLEDVLYYLSNTDIQFESFNVNPKKCKLPETFNEIVVIENPIVIDGCVGINVNEPIMDIRLYGKSINFIEITDSKSIETLNKKFGVQGINKKRFFSLQLPAEEVTTLDYKYIEVYIFRKSTVADIQERKNEKFTYDYKYRHYSDIVGGE